MFRFLALAFIVSFTSCNKTDNQAANTPLADTFTVQNNQETMPVWVYGKQDAKCILIAVHGGPGSDVLDFRNYQGGTGFKKVEEQYAVAYWQQRASGQSTGSDNTALFTIEQYAEDLDKVVDQVKSRYPDKKVVLLGHSWGGTLTSTYLKDAGRRAKIAAWINAAGVHNGQNLFAKTIADINTEADSRIALNENVTYWQGVKTQLQNSPNSANALAYSVLDKIPQVTVKVNNADFKYTNRALISNNALFSQILAIDNTSAMQNLNMKVLLLWGTYDFAVSKQLRAEVISKIPAQNVTSITFPASGHYMMFHEPNLFATSLTDFLSSL